MLWLTHPDNILAKAYIAKAYQTYVLEKSEQETNKLLATAEGIDSALPCALIDKRNDLLTMPIFELAEQIYTLFNIGNIKGEDAYLYAFYDALTDFIANNTADIDSFVEEWNDSIAAKTIQASAIDGIRIITIHQSKGLEFEHVVIPFCDWTLEKGNTHKHSRVVMSVPCPSVSILPPSSTNGLMSTHATSSANMLAKKMVLVIWLSLSEANFRPHPLKTKS